MSRLAPTFESPINRMRVVELLDEAGGIAFIIENAPVGRSSMMTTLDTRQQDELMHYLQDLRSSELSRPQCGSEK